MIPSVYTSGRHCSTLLPNVVVEWLAHFVSCAESPSIKFRPAVFLFFSYYMQITGQSLKLGHGRFLPCPCAFMTAQLSYHSTLYNLIH